MSNRERPGHALREWMHRLLGFLRRGRSDDDLAEELRLHVELAAEDGRARRGGSREGGTRARGAAHAMDALRDQRGLPWLDALAADVVFGSRQLRKHRVVSLVAILSLGLAIGAATAAYRLVDAVLLRPLPVASPERLFYVSIRAHDSDKRLEVRDDFDYPTFRRYSATLGDRAALMVVGTTARLEITFGGVEEAEPVVRQYVSGNVFPVFGVQPSLGRLLAPGDNVTPGGHPVAVISHDFWSRRFARDPSVIGKAFRMGHQRYEIVGVAPQGFTGTEPGFVTDLFIPAVMNVQALNSPGWSWFRLWARPNDGVAPAQMGSLLQTPGEEVLLLPAGSGASGVQKQFRRPLFILAALATLVLLVACANVANVLSAQALSRAREMALRVSIGAGRGRLIQLVLVESALLAVCASILGMLVAAWSAPAIVSLLAPPERPLRLVLDADGRALALGVTLTIAVTMLFGLAPALRASFATPVGALKGADDPQVHRRLTHGLVAAQMAFCVFVVFIAGLFVVTLDRLSKQPLGFSPDRLLAVPVETTARTQPVEIWTQVEMHLRQIRGVDAVAIAGWAPLSGNRWRASVQVPGRPAAPRSPNALSIGPGYFATMGIGWVDGRDFRRGDTPPRLDASNRPVAGVGIVNEAFVRTFFDGRSPIGAVVTMNQRADLGAPMAIVGIVRDAMYSSVREPIPPTVYVPFAGNGNATLIVRTAGDPAALASIVRREVPRAHPDFRARGAETQRELVRGQLIRERLLATLSLVFAGVALLLGAIGLYGVLNYAVVRRRREIGIRMALGARATHVVRSVTAEVIVLVSVGAAIGLAGGLAFGRVVESLLFQVKPTDPTALAIPLMILAAAATVAAVPPALRAVRTDPAETLRTE